jgi:hypothetical protein
MRDELSVYDWIRFCFVIAILELIVFYILRG